MQDASKIYETLDGILKNTKSFAEVVNAVFASIDKDGSGRLEITEIEEFITAVCHDMGLRQPPDKEYIKELFEALDEDQSKAISIDELAKFLRVLFEEQLRQLGKTLKRRDA